MTTITKNLKPSELAKAKRELIAPILYDLCARIEGKSWDKEKNDMVVRECYRAADEVLKWVDK